MLYAFHCSFLPSFFPKIHQKISYNVSCSSYLVLGTGEAFEAVTLENTFSLGICNFSLAGLT